MSTPDARVRLIASGRPCQICDTPALKAGNGESAVGGLRRDGTPWPEYVSNPNRIAGLSFKIHKRACYNVYRCHFAQSDASAGWYVGTFCVRCLYAAQDALPTMTIDAPSVVTVPVTVYVGIAETVSFDRILELMLAELRTKP